ncbi:14107_t:CDS:10, partial [Entrophospora sp. SA101]
AKKEQLKKEGKLLTKSQKAKKQQGELRLQQLLQAGTGIKIEGFENKQAGEQPKKPNYSIKPKNEQVIKEQWDLSSEDEEKEGMEDKVQEKGAKGKKTEVGTKDKEKEEGVKSKGHEKGVKAKEKGGGAKGQKKGVVANDKGKEEEAKGKEKEDGAKSKEKVVSSKKDSEEETESSEEESDSEDEEMTEHQKQIAIRKQEAAERRQKRHEEALAARSKENLRSPICCILGHVDTGKTKLLDKVRKTNVQEGEAGGITQQIGATYFPMEVIKTKTAPLNKVIHTPGHESFTNLRTRGSSLCNIAILVVDIMHGLEPQTLESLRLLRDRKTPFIVALNKIDRIYGWKTIPDNAFRDSLEKQSDTVKREFQDRVEKAILAFSEQGLNSCLYYENKNFAKYVSIVPTSAVTGEGVPDMLMLLINLTQSRMSNELMYLTETECTVLEVKVVEGLGTTIDAVLSNGVLNEGDKIVLCGVNGPIVTVIRALLTPQPLRELRIKSAYVHHKTVSAALGVKIAAQDLEKAIAGSRVMVVGPDDDEEDLKDEVMSDLKDLMSSVDKSGKGVCVQASTLGSLEALIEFLRVSNIPVSGINIGPVHKKDIMRAAIMLEKARELAVMLCFDVKVDKDAQDLADELGVNIFKADIIYHLFDQFTAYNKEILEQKRKDQAPQAVFPCILKIIAVFNKRDPIIVGVDVAEGVLRTGTPICVVKTDPTTNVREIITLGKVTSIEQNHKSIEQVKRGQVSGGVAIKIECPVYETPKLCGRHFTESDDLYSRSRSGMI